MTGPELHGVLTDPANWMDGEGPCRYLSLTAPQIVRERWFDAAHPSADTSALPTWDDLSVEEREILVWAAESSGMLTGAFGIMEDMLADLGPDERLAWVDRELAPLLPYVREGWIEVQHRPGDGSFTLIPLDALRTAFQEPSSATRRAASGAWASAASSPTRDWPSGAAAGAANGHAGSISTDTETLPRTGACARSAAHDLRLHPPSWAVTSHGSHLSCPD